MTTSHPPYKVVNKIKELNEAFNAQFEGLERERDGLRAAVAAARRREEEEHRARIKALEDRTEAMEREWAGKAEALNKQRKEALRAIHQEMEVAKDVLSDWLRNLDDALVSSAEERQSSESRREAPSETSVARWTGEANNNNDRSDKKEDEEGSRQPLSSTPSSISNDNDVASRKRKFANGDNTSDDGENNANRAKRVINETRRRTEDRESGNEAGEEVSADDVNGDAVRKTTPKPKLVEAASSDPNHLDVMFETLVANNGGKPKALVDVFLQNQKVQVVPVEGLHARELKRATTCRACGCKIDTTCYTGVIGATGKRCESHKFCMKCGEYIYARFEDKCPGRFWFNCA